MKRSFKKFAAVALCLVMLVSSVQIAVAAAPDEQMQNPLYMPLRFVFESGGAEVDWDPDRFVVIAELGDTVFEFFIGNMNARANGEVFALSHPVIMDGGVTFISYLDASFLFTEDAAGFDGTIFATVSTAFQLMQTLSIPGATVALVDIDSGFTWTQGFGFADVENEIFVNENTIFGLGSIAKTFTAIAVMQLVEEGLVNLDTPIVEYLPDFSIQPSPLLGGDYRNITPRMLLTHTSGILPNILGYNSVTENEYYPDFFNNFLEHLSSYFMNTPEDQVFTYNNNGFNLLGILVAELTGDGDYFDDFAAYMDENLFARADMTSSTFVLGPAHMPYLARPYIDVDTPATPLFMNSLPTGGLFSTAYDMANFMEIILADDGTLVRPGTIGRMMQAHDFDFTTTLGGLEYGLGFMRMVSMDGFRTTGHNGAVFYYYADMILDVENGLGVFVAVNGANGLFAASPLASAILMNAVVDKTGGMEGLNLATPRADAAAELVEMPIEELQALEGLFIGQNYMLLEVHDNGLLTLVIPGISGESLFPLNPMSDGSFYSAAGRFWFDEMEIDGELGLVMKQGDLGRHIIAVRAPIENFMATEEFEPWIGTFVPQPRSGEISLISSFTYSVDSRGIATMTTTQIAPIMPITAVHTADEVFLMGVENIIFGNDGRAQSFDLIGMRFVRQ